MSVKIHIEAGKIWPFFKANPERMVREMVAVAENEETEYAVYVTDNGFGSPGFMVYRGDTQIYEEDVTSENDCAETAKSLYDEYLFPVDTSEENHTKYDKEWNPLHADDDDDAELSLQEEMEEIIDERKDELYCAMYELLNTFLRCPGNGEPEAESVGDIASQAVDDFCEYLAEEHLVSVYRPTFTTDDSGEEVFTEYPYDD